MMAKLRTKTNKKGFTLVELVMVVALIAILAAIAVPTVSNVIDTANKNVDASNAQTVELAIKTAYSEVKSGVWTPDERTGNVKVDETNLNVGEALAHEGIKELPKAKAKDAVWSYESGKIFLDSNGAKRSTFNSNSDVATIIKIS